ncbi:MAG: NADH-quinone oxidoreductase subunit NuoE [Anaerolineae bacterium]|nr:NADH-quinone oxidoreductase subunit NuoE [Anaerolineae bacterium]
MSEQAPQFKDPQKRAMVLTALYIAQEQHGYLTQEAIQQAADRLGLSAKDVFETASFYSMFRTRPVGRYVLQVCTGLCCWMEGGGEKLVEFIAEKLGIGPGETTADGQFTLQTVECLASCGTSPTMRVNDDLYEDLTPDKLDRLIDQLAGR